MNTYRLNTSFFAILTILIAVFFFHLLFPPSHGLLFSQQSVIFLEGRDFFADFFNVMRYMSDGSPYFSTINESDGHGAFPLSYVLMYPFAQIVNYSGMSLEDCWNSKPAMCSALMFLVISLYFYWDSLLRLTVKYHVSQHLPTLFLFTSVFVFSVERGNQILFAAALVNYFLAYNDSKSDRKRLFALVCLCVAATLKGYPALFGLPMLVQKRYKDIAFCVVLTLSLVVFPFLLVDQGFANVPKLLENIGLNNKAYINSYNYMFGMHKLVSFGYAVTHSSMQSFQSVGNTIGIVRMVETLLLLVTIPLAFLEKRAWLQQLLIACGIIMFPINSGFYCGLYLLPVVLLFFTQREVGTVDYVFMALFCLVLNPLQLVYTSPLNGQTFYLSSLISNTSLAFAWLLAIGLSLRNVRSLLTPVFGKG